MKHLKNILNSESLLRVNIIHFFYFSYMLETLARNKLSYDNLLYVHTDIIMYIHILCAHDTSSTLIDVSMISKVHTT